MEQHTFDRVVRQFGVETSRRVAMRGLVGSALGSLLSASGLRSARAQEGGLAPAAACTSTSECSQAGGSVVCADNGWGDDGALNCCRSEGGACSDHTESRDCCGGLYCRDGVCSNLSPSGELPPGSYCTSTSECSQEGGPVDCADNGIPSDGPLNCCRYAGGACGNDAGCCAGLICAGGVCSGDSGLLALGAACSATAECAPSSAGSIICASNNVGYDGPLNCCLEEGGWCGSVHNHCCGSMICLEGRCQFEGGGGLLPGATCSETSQCDQTAGPAICSDNGLRADGELNCCLLEAVPCARDGDCCAGLFCGDNEVAADGPLTCCALAGSRCLTSAGCCGNAFCIDGFCQ